jgi:hypothetical protein
VLLRKHFFLKNVRAGASGLLVSNRLREVQIPYANILEVRESPWDRTRITTVRSTPAPPSAVKSISSPPTIGVSGAHPVVAMLDQRARTARHQAVRRARPTRY